MPRDVKRAPGKPHPALARAGHYLGKIGRARRYRVMPSPTSILDMAFADGGNLLLVATRQIAVHGVSVFMTNFDSANVQYYLIP
jgi:hypothetical protein